MTNKNDTVEHIIEQAKSIDECVDIHEKIELLQSIEASAKEESERIINEER